MELSYSMPSTSLRTTIIFITNVNKLCLIRVEYLVFHLTVHASICFDSLTDSKVCNLCKEGPDEEVFGKYFVDESSGFSVHQYCMVRSL